MDDKAILVAVGEAYGWTRYPDDSVEHGNVWHLDKDRTPFGRIRDFRDFNPLVRKDQAFDLLVDFDIKISKNRDDKWVAMWSHCRGEEHLDPLRAICLAVVEKHRNA